MEQLFIFTALLQTVLITFVLGKRATLKNDSTCQSVIRRDQFSIISSDLAFYPSKKHPQDSGCGGFYPPFLSCFLRLFIGRFLL
jgi:hypothetical protein